MPPPEDQAAAAEQLGPDPLAAGGPVDHRLEVTPQVHHPNAIDKLRTTLVIPYRSTTRPYAPRAPRQS